MNIYKENIHRITSLFDAGMDLPLDPGQMLAKFDAANRTKITE